jgi:hypothetical protein
VSATLAVAAVAAVAWSGASLSAAGPGTYAAWSVGGGSGAFTGAMAIGLAGFPSATFTSDATGATGVEINSGAATYLPTSSPWGAVFGSSQDHQYASVRYAAGQTPSTTTFTFDSPTPATGWGFSLGDIDADTVRITATDATGSAVPVSALGFQGGFNYSPPNSDEPTWDAGTGTLIGSGSDTTGAAGWFRPTVAIRTLTFTFSVLSGFPIYQIWFAALPEAVTTTTTTTTAAPTTAAPTTAAPTTAAPSSTSTSVAPTTTSQTTRSWPGAGASLRFAG